MRWRARVTCWVTRCWCARAAHWCRPRVRWSWLPHWPKPWPGVQALLAPNRFDPASTKRRFRVAMSDYSAAIFLPKLIRVLRREAPGIDLQIIQASREGMVDGVLNGDLDLAAGVFPDMPCELRTTPLFEEHYTCLVDRNSLPENATLDLPTYLARPHVLLECAAAVPRKSNGR